MPGTTKAPGLPRHVWPLMRGMYAIRVQARETGICPVREELYAQCFDELIRQVTINCAERGLLLLRVRDEMRMTIAAYQVGHTAHRYPTSCLTCPMCCPP